MIAYLDTSALVKRYITESGSRWMRTFLDERANGAFTSRLTVVEGACTFARRRREGFFSDIEHRLVSEMFLYEFEHRYSVLEIDPQVSETACQLAHRNPLRAYDALHLATAWLFNQGLLDQGHEPLAFVCADARLLEIARAEGLRVENPNDHG